MTMIWANLAIGLGIATLSIFFALLAGTLINQWNLKRKEYFSGGKFLDSLIKDYIRQFSPGKSAQHQQRQQQRNDIVSNTSGDHNQTLNHKGIQNFYDQVFQNFEQSEDEKEKCELKKILDFLKDFSHPQNGPNWRHWANSFQNHWGFAPAKLAVIEGLELTAKLPLSPMGDMAKAFFDYLERIVFIQIWGWEQFDHYLPANATAALSASLGILRQNQHIFLSCWLLETAGMPPVSFMSQQKMAMGQLKKMTKEKRTLLLIKMTGISGQTTFSDHLKKKYSLWDEQFGPNSHQNQKREQQKHDNSEDEYNILGATPHDSIHHIKKMYRKMALNYHPDQFSNEKLSAFERKAIEKRFVKIKMAYEKIISQKTKTG